MSTVVRSWIRALCNTCGTKRIFVLGEGWVLACAECGTEKRLETNGLLANV